MTCRASLKYAVAVIVTPLLLILVPAFLGGCGTEGGKSPTPAAAIGGYLAAGGEGYARQLLETWSAAEPAPPELKESGDPVSMLVIYQQAQALRPGFVRIQVNMVLLDGKSVPVARDGKLWVLLNRRDGDKYSPAGVWEFDSKQVASCYRSGMLSGYALDLSWPGTDDASIYPMLFRWQSSTDSSHILTGSIRVVDSMPDLEIQKQ